MPLHSPAITRLPLHAVIMVAPNRNIRATLRDNRRLSAKGYLLHQILFKNKHPVVLDGVKLQKIGCIHHAFAKKMRSGGLMRKKNGEDQRLLPPIRNHKKIPRDYCPG